MPGKSLDKSARNKLAGEAAGTIKSPRFVCMFADCYLDTRLQPGRICRGYFPGKGSDGETFTIFPYQHPPAPASLSMADEQRVPGTADEKRKCEDFTALYPLEGTPAVPQPPRSLTEPTGEYCPPYILIPFFLCRVGTRK